jgi:hypothetical protein
MTFTWKRTQSLALLISFLWIFEGCGPKKLEEADCGFVQIVYGQRISWKDSAAIPLYVHESFPANMLPGLEAAIATWQNVMGRPVFRIAQTNYQSSGPRQDGMNVIYWMSAWEADKRTEQARTSVYWVGDQIREADIRLNDKDFNFYLNQGGYDQDVHLESLMLHELGHVLGLKHKDGGGSVMGTYLASSTVRNQVSAIDKENLKCEY